MKTLLILIVLVILTIVASYAQTTKHCICRKTTSHLRARKTYASNKTKPPKFTNRIHNVNKEEVPGTYEGNDVWQPEYSVELNKNNGGFDSENTYTGQYPQPALQDTRVSPQEAGYRGSKPSELCLYNCR